VPPSAAPRDPAGAVTIEIPVGPPSGGSTITYLPGSGQAGPSSAGTLGSSSSSSSRAPPFIGPLTQDGKEAIADEIEAAVRSDLTYSQYPNLTEILAQMRDIVTFGRGTIPAFVQGLDPELLKPAFLLLHHFAPGVSRRDSRAEPYLASLAHALAPFANIGKSSPQIDIEGAERKAADRLRRVAGEGQQQPSGPGGAGRPGPGTPGQPGRPGSPPHTPTGPPSPPPSIPRSTPVGTSAHWRWGLKYRC
jgi:hypothetical protein